MQPNMVPVLERDEPRFPPEDGEPSEFDHQDKPSGRTGLVFGFPSVLTKWPCWQAEIRLPEVCRLLIIHWLYAAAKNI
jgi:hypothetical protein